MKASSAAALLISAGIICISATDSYAQLNNAPYSFKYSGGGMGMSSAGKEALIGQKLLGSTPDNLVRGVDGSLLNIQRGPGDVAIVSTPGGQYLPQFKGTSFRGSNTDISVGTFNAYFSPSGNTGSGYMPLVQGHSSATVSTWTGRVTSNGVPVSYLDDSVDTWTGQVLTLNH